MKHINIPIFVPHIGCPHQCSFCNQNSITGVVDRPNRYDVINIIENFLSKNNKADGHYKIQVAFFGGSFTAINKEYMIELLSAVSPYIKSKQVHSIRISTRPDCISEAILNILKFYGVETIELGVQSMVDEVLSLNNRGHTTKDVIRASEMIKKYKSFELCLQMMTGLFGSCEKYDIYTAEQLVKLSPKSVRIYPTVVMKGTMLESLFLHKKYIPLPLNNAVDLCANLLELFKKNHIDVIRVGLDNSDSFRKNYIAGPWHISFRELCESRIMFKNLIRRLHYIGPKQKKLVIVVNPKSVSKLCGHKKENIKKFNDMGYYVKIEQNISIEMGDMDIKITN